jgi:hypothetical protein
LPGEWLLPVPGEAGVNKAAGGVIPVPLPIGDRPEVIRFQPAFRCRRAAGGDECGDEPPVGQVYPVTVEHVAHGGAPQFVPAQAL